LDELVAGGWTLIAAECLLTAIGSVAAWRLRALTVPGAIGMYLIGTAVLVTGGLTWLAPTFLFFATWIVLGRIRSEDAWRDNADAPDVRGLGKVAANSVVALIGVLLLHFAGEPFWTVSDSALIYLGAVGAANADVWGTDFGVRFGGAPHDIITGRAKTPGQSGSVTYSGTIGAAVGALLIAAMLPLLDPSYVGRWRPVVLLAIAGWLGSVVDSALGSLAQLRYRCPRCGTYTESPRHCGASTIVMSGLLTNNQVSWACTATGALVAWLWIR